MTFVSYIPLASLEGLAIFILMFSIYRIPFKEFAIETVSVSVILTSVLYLLKVETSFSGLANLISLSLMVLYLRLVVKSPTIYSIVMTGVGYVSYSMIQTTIRYILETFKVVNPGAYLEMNWGRALIQICSIIISFVVANLVRHLRQGFNFVPVDSSVPVKYRPLNIILMSAAVLASAIVAVVIYFYEHREVIGLLGAVIIFAIALYVLIYLSIRKEYEEE